MSTSGNSKFVQLQRNLFLSKSGNRHASLPPRLATTNLDASLPPHLAPTVAANEASESNHWCISISPNAMSTIDGAIGPLPPVTTFCYHVASKRHIAHVVGRLPLTLILWIRPVAIPLFQGRRSTSRFGAFAPN